MRTFGVAACLLVVLPCASAVAQSAASTPKAASTQAVVPAAVPAAPAASQPLAQPSVYTSKSPAFTYRYPAEFQTSGDGTQLTDEALKESSTPAQKVLSCVSMPLLATNSQAGREGEAIMLLSVDLACLKAPVDASILGPLAQSSLTEGLQKIRKPVVTETAAYKLDAHDAVFLQGSVPSAAGGAAEYAGEACSLIEQHAMCWMVMANDKDRLATLLGTEVRFADHAPAVIVPASVVTGASAAK